MVPLIEQLQIKTCMSWLGLIRAKVAMIDAKSDKD